MKSVARVRFSWLAGTVLLLPDSSQGLAAAQQEPSPSVKVLISESKDGEPAGAIVRQMVDNHTKILEMEVLEQVKDHIFSRFLEGEQLNAHAPCQLSQHDFELHIDPTGFCSLRFTVTKPGRPARGLWSPFLMGPCAYAFREDMDKFSLVVCLYGDPAGKQVCHAIHRTEDFFLTASEDRIEQFATTFMLDLAPESTYRAVKLAIDKPASSQAVADGGQEGLPTRWQWVSFMDRGALDRFRGRRQWEQRKLEDALASALREPGPRRTYFLTEKRACTFTHFLATQIRPPLALQLVPSRDFHFHMDPSGFCTSFVRVENHTHEKYKFSLRFTLHQDLDGRDAVERACHTEKELRIQGQRTQSFRLAFRVEAEPEVSYQAVRLKITDANQLEHRLPSSWKPV